MLCLRAHASDLILLGDAAEIKFGKSMQPGGLLGVHSYTAMLACAQQGEQC